MNEILQVAGQAIGFPYLVDIAAGIGAGAAALGITLPFLPPGGVKTVGKAFGILLRVFRQKPAKDRQFVGMLRGTTSDFLEGVDDGLK